MAYAYVYMMASRKNGALYIGVTRNLGLRIAQHKAKTHPNSFTAKYNIDRLVWFEDFDLIAEAIAYEKRLKKYKRVWKVTLIEDANPDWRDIDPGSCGFLDEN